MQQMACFPCGMDNYSKCSVLHNAIAARMARSQSQDQELASTSTNSEPTENGTPNDSLTGDVVDSGQERRPSSLSVKLSPKESLTLRPTKQGYLDKLSGGKHKAPKWDNRYFELAEGGHLHYYKKAQGKIMNTIYL
ncbi:hypothetical protein AC249_AIPGENE28502 [Exaiptasia diaphana]|nr:hypothetical protein AC249_AIPGENE28502 [Exaiptasia diaphana]